MTSRRGSKNKLQWSMSRMDSVSTNDDLSGQHDALLKKRLSDKRRLDHCLEHIRQNGQNRHTLSHVEDKLCDMFRSNDGSGRVNITRFLEALALSGLRQSDPRLQEIKMFVSNIQTACAGDERFCSAEGLNFHEDIFKGVIMDNIDLINKALTGEMVIPEFDTFCEQIEELYLLGEKEEGGQVASYIPQLERMEPQLWGVAVCTVDGQRFSMGDVHTPFTIQSASKPISYAIACGEQGPDFVHSYVGQEPSGRRFNEIVLDSNSRPHNPMINAGAIMTSALIRPQLQLADRFDFVFRTYRRLTGGEYLGFNNAVFLSERQAADRNFALAYFMRENGCFPPDKDLQQVLDFYFQMCSLEITCESAAVIAGTLANGGVCPTTAETVLETSAVRNTLCLMHSCGMYDYSGQFAFKCGLPAKSGVSGVILLVIPSVMGIALFSPPLDPCGNSVRGLRFCKELVRRFNFHHFDNMSALRCSNGKLDPRNSTNEKRADMVHRVLFAAAAGDLNALKRYSLMEMDLETADYDERTALHLAAAEGHLAVVAFLLKKCRVKVNPQDRWGCVPLDDARMAGHEEVHSFLLAQYAEDGIPVPAQHQEPLQIKLNNLTSLTNALTLHGSPSPAGSTSTADGSRCVDALMLHELPSPADNIVGLDSDTSSSGTCPMSR